MFFLDWKDVYKDKYIEKGLYLDTKTIIMFSFFGRMSRDYKDTETRR